MKQIPNDILVDKTVEYMIRNDLSDLPIEYNRGSEGHWSKICEMCLNRTDVTAIKNIHSNWKRNSFNYRNLVLEKLSNRNVGEPSSYENSSNDSSSAIGERSSTIYQHISEVKHETFLLPFFKFKKYISGIRRKILKQSINL